MTKKATHQNRVLAHEERIPDHGGEVPDWQLVVMCHYEYARCSKLMLQTVNNLRESGNPKTAVTDIPFRETARLLAWNFPEFPDTPWETLAPQIRSQRLAAIGITEANGLYSPAPAAWQAWECGDADADRRRDERVGVAMEAMGSFEIDFSQANGVIIKQFAQWLDGRRVFLLQKYDSTGKLAPRIKRNANDRFRVWLRPSHKKGGEAWPKKYRLALTALGHLRKYIHSKREAARANESGAVLDQSSWDKYEFYAGRMLECLEAAWRCPGEFLNVHDRFLAWHRIGFAALRPPPRSLDDARRRAAIKVRQFVDEHFTVAKLGTSKSPATRPPR